MIVYLQVTTMMGGKAARPSGTPAQARPAEDPTIDFNNVEGTFLV